MITRSIALLSLIPMITVAQGQTFRCGSKLVMEGDSSAAVLAKCGNPTQADQTSVTRPSTAGPNDPQNELVSATVEVLIDTWLFNFGPNRLMMRVHIENGTVVQIDTLGYGYTDNP
jgi:Protein of unknown function (DUF2845)